MRRNKIFIIMVLWCWNTSIQFKLLHNHSSVNATIVIVEMFCFSTIICLWYSSLRILVTVYSLEREIIFIFHNEIKVHSKIAPSPSFLFTYVYPEHYGWMS